MISSTSGSTSMNENMLPIGTHMLGPAGPVEMMAGADDAAEEDQDQLEIHRALGELARDQADRHQQIGAHAGGEELERLLDPEMHHPPAPEVGERERLLDPGERDHAEHVEHGDVDGGGPDQVLQPDAAGPELAASPATASRRSATARGTPARSTAPARRRSRSARSGRAGCRTGPDCRTRTSLVDVAHDAEIVADQRAGDDQQRHPEQQIDQQALAARLAAAGDRGREEQRRRRSTTGRSRRSATGYARRAGS